MKSITTINPNDQFGLLIQGPPKTGKTELACLFPAPWIANADSNLAGFARRCLDQQFTSDMVFSDLQREDDGKQISDAEAVWKRFITEDDAATRNPEIKTIVYDSMTTMAMIAIAFVMADRVKRTGKGTKDQTEIQDWNTNQNLWKTIIMRKRSSGKLFVVLSHEEAMKDEISGGVTKWVPNIPGSKLQAAFSGFFSDVWRTEVEETKKAGGITETNYIVRTKPTSRLDLGGSVSTPEATFIRPNSLAEQRALLYKLLKYEEKK